MNPAAIFSIANTTALLMWIFMIFLPKLKPTKFLIEFKVIPVLLSIGYAIYIVQAMLIGGAMDFGSLESVMALFTEENAVLAGWIHYLAFDLLIGMWILQQNEKVGLHHLLLVPCLIGTFMFGPIGFLLFVIMKAIKTRK